MIIITDMAKNKIQEALNKTGGKYLRLSKQLGWGGPQIGMTLDEPQETDRREQINGVNVLISEFDKLYFDDMDNMTIDYVKQPFREGFIISGPGKSC